MKAISTMMSRLCAQLLNPNHTYRKIFAKPISKPVVIFDFHDLTYSSHFSFSVDLTQDSPKPATDSDTAVRS